MSLQPPTHIAAADTVSDGSESERTTPAFTPPANALLVVTAFGALGGGVPADFSLTNSAGLTFTRRAQAQGSALGGSSTLALWTAETGSAPAAMTVTRHSSLPVIMGGIMLFAASDDLGIAPQFVAGQVDDATTTGTTLVATLPATPRASSCVLGIVVSGPQLGGITPGTGFTEIAEFPIDATAADAVMQGQYDLASADATCDWSGLSGTAAVKLGIAIEIAPGSQALALGSASHGLLARPIAPQIGARSVTAGAAQASLAAQAAVPQPGTRTRSAGPATAGWTAVAITINQTGPQIIPIGPALAQLLARVITSTAGPTTQAIAPATAALGAMPMQPLQGGVSRAIGASVGQWAAFVIAPTGASLVRPVGTAIAELEAQTLTSYRGAMSHAIGPAVGTWVARSLLSTTGVLPLRIHQVSGGALLVIGRVVGSGLLGMDGAQGGPLLRVQRLHGGE